ncbi:MAG: glycosyltransferase, partial [Bacteroidales bacterium]
PTDKPNNVPIRFINVSCFEDRSKNLSGLVKCVEMLVIEGLDVECVLVGSGEDFNEISSLIKSKKLEKQFIITGQLNEMMVADQMKKCHFYVQSSNYENVPVVISEALMCGLPVVATNVGGLNEMIDDSNGYLVEHNSLTELSSAIRMMTENYSAYDRQKIRQAAMHKYSAVAVRQQMLQLYSVLIK